MSPEARLPDVEEHRLLIYLLDDIARLPVVSSRAEWLPLLRQIQRGTQLNTLRGANDVETLRHLQSKLHQEISEFNGYCRSLQRQGLDLVQFSSELDRLFIDADYCPPLPIFRTHSYGPSQSTDALAQEQEDRGWLIAYLLALLPTVHRPGYRTISITPEISDHFAEIDAAYHRAKSTLTEGTLRFVLTIARLYLGKSLSYLDLVQEGVLGLMRAAESYREQRGARFQHYASAWIRQAITRAIADRSRLIRLPVHMHEAVSQLIAQREQLANELGRLPTDLEFGLAQGWLSETDIRALQINAQAYQLRRRTRGARLDYLALVEASNRRKERLRKSLELDTDASPDSIEATEETPEVKPAPFMIVPNLGWEEKAADRASAVWYRLTQELGHEPSFCQFAVAMGEMTPAEAHLYQLACTTEFEAAVAAARKGLRMTAKQISRMQMFEAVYYPLEWLTNLAEMDAPDEEGLAELPDQSYEQLHKQITVECLDQIFQELCSDFTSRQAQILQRRLGLGGHQEQTLEEIGGAFNITRERVRQIEAKTILRLRNPRRSRRLRDMLAADADLSTSVWERHRKGVLAELARRGTREAEARENEARREQSLIDHLLQQRMLRGRRRLYNTFSQRGRAELFRQILMQAGEPLHYSVIHERAMADLPEKLGFSKSTTYATLFYHPLFQGYTKGFFGLAEWGRMTEDPSGVRVFTQCPEPLLNAAGDPRSFFESVLVGQAWLQARPSMSAREFYLEMLAWANRNHENVFEAQAAFDAWQAVGLLAPVAYTTSPNAPLKLTLPSGMSLSETRAYCLDQLCRLVPRMSELLLVLEQVARPTLTTIQCILFGSEKAGYDVPARLRLLAAFDAVRREGDVWRLGAPGKAALAAHPPQDLPDLDVQVTVDEPDNTPVEIEWLDDFEQLSDSPFMLQPILGA